MNCFTDVPAFISYSACLMSIVCMCVSTFGAIISCKNNKKIDLFSDNENDKKHLAKDVEYVNNHYLNEEKNYVFDEKMLNENVNEDNDHFEEVVTEESFLRQIVAPFDLPEDYEQTLIDSCIVVSYDNENFDKDALLKKALTLLHWFFVENEEKKQENEVSKKDE